MKKIPTLFERVYNDEGRVIGITENVKPGLEWVLNGEGEATVKIDGSCCAVINGVFYKRFDAKAGRKIPEDAIPCSDPDPVTGHWPHWVAVDPTNKADKWFWEAWNNTFLEYGRPQDGTYEAIGKHFNNNAYNKTDDILVPHGSVEIDVERSFEGIKKWLYENHEEGIVFWKDGEPQCKIKRKDFGFRWP